MLKIIDSLKRTFRFISHVTFWSILTSSMIITVVVSIVVIYHAIKNRIETPTIQMSWSTKKCVKVIDLGGERICPDDLNAIRNYRIDWVK